MKKALVVIISIFFGITSFSQSAFKDGFIITNNNDTIFGKVRASLDSSNSLICEFIDADSKTYKSFLPGEIMAFRMEGSKYYVSKEISLDNKEMLVFLEYLVQGIVNLYYYKGPPFEHYFIEKNGTLINLSNENQTLSTIGGLQYTTQSNQYKRALNYAFQDSKDYLEIVNKTAFSYNSLISGTKAYHNSVCDDYSCIDYTKSDKLILYMEPDLGFIFSKFSFYKSTDKYYDNHPSFGINLRYSINKSDNLFSLSTGMSYSYNNYGGLYTSSLNISRLFISSPNELHLILISMKYSILRLPLTIEYSKRYGKMQPFLFLGWFYSRNFNTESTLIRKNYQEHPDPGNWGPLAGAGLQLDIFNFSELIL
jgi:hypothetical protein